MTDHLLYSEDFTGEIRTYIKPDGVPIPEITTVGGWTPFWREGDGRLRPEMRVIDASNPNYLAPVMRLNDVGRGIKMHKQWGVIDAGYYRQMTVPAGVALVQAALRGHCWYSQCDIPIESLWKKADNVWHPVTEGMRLWAGIDPTGGTDPYAASVVWGWGERFDEHDFVYLSVVDTGPLITVFVRTDNDYGFKHVDAYICGVEVLGYSDGTEEPPSSGPEVDYEVVVNLLPQDVTLPEKVYVLEQTHHARQTILQSADDAARLVAGGAFGSRVQIWDEHRFPTGIRGWLLDRGVDVVIGCDLSPDFDPPPDPTPDPTPEPPPDPAWKPHNYVPFGTKLGFHAAGDGGQTGDVFAPLTPLGAQPPTAKVIVSLGAAKDIKAIDPTVKTIGRMIDVPGFGNVEGFDYNGDAYGQAVGHMNAIAQAFGPHWQYYDYIEILNEQKPPHPQAHILLAEFFKHCMQSVENWGWSSRIALFSHSVGTPEPRDWDAIANSGVFEMAAAGGHVISLHEYNLSTTGGCLYRYRDLYERIILPKQLNIPLYITEYNVDVADAGNADVMFQNWVAYDAEVSRDPYVAGVHIYSTGEVYSAYLNTIYSLWNRYRAYAISVKERVNG